MLNPLELLLAYPNYLLPPLILTFGAIVILLLARNRLQRFSPDLARHARLVMILVAAIPVMVVLITLAFPSAYLVINATPFSEILAGAVIVSWLAVEALLLYKKRRLVASKPPTESKQPQAPNNNDALPRSAIFSAGSVLILSGLISIWDMFEKHWHENKPLNQLRSAVSKAL